MIPKVIHYCWFGRGKYPSITKKCISSWKKYCPDFEIKCWNEDNYDVHKNPYVWEAYQKKKWAFVSDFARLDIVYHHGGIYLDTDVELIKSLDSLLEESCFLASAADGSGISTGLGFGAEEGHEAIRAMLHTYDDRHFVVNGGIDLTACVTINSAPFLQQGYDSRLREKQTVMNALILPSSYFDPIDGPSSELHQTEETIGIHRATCSWYTGFPRLKALLRISIGLDNVVKIKKWARQIGRRRKGDR